MQNTTITIGGASKEYEVITHEGTGFAWYRNANGPAVIHVPGTKKARDLCWAMD